MPDLNLEPHEYGQRGKRRLIPDDPAALSAGIVIAFLILGWIYWNRDALTANPAVFFGGTAIAAAAAGMLLALLLKHFNL